MNQAELVMRRRNVLAFIQADPVNVVITREAAAVKDNTTGGYDKGTISTLTAQQFRIVQNKRRYNSGVINAEAGELPHTDYLMLGTYDNNLRVDDEFTSYGVNYKVKGIQENRTESILAAIDMVGATNRA